MITSTTIELEAAVRSLWCLSLELSASTNNVQQPECSSHEPSAPSLSSLPLNPMISGRFPSMSQNIAESSRVLDKLEVFEKVLTLLSERSTVRQVLGLNE